MKNYIKYNKKYTFNLTFGGYKPYFTALEDIFDKFNHSNIKLNTVVYSIVKLNGFTMLYNGIEHAKTVMYHAWCALEDYDISDEDKLAVLLASLLHGYFVL